MVLSEPCRRAIQSVHRDPYLQRRSGVKSPANSSTPRCVTVNVCPPTVSVPVRSPPRFSAASNVTVPFPVPEAPFVIVSQGALALAVHVHVAADAVTVIDPEPPSLLTSCLFGEIEMAQGGGGGGGGAA